MFVVYGMNTRICSE